MPLRKALPLLSFLDFDLKVFAAGLAGGGLILAAAGLTLSVNASATVHRLQDLMASKTLSIEKPGFPKEPTETHAIEAPAANPPQEATSHAPESTQTEKSPDKPGFPLPGLTEKTPQGLLPIIRKSDGLTPFRAYARPYKQSQTLPRISVVIESFGLKEDYSLKALSLPPEVTLLLSPYTSGAAGWQQKAQENGHELWLELPMETEQFGDNDPGPKAISSTELLPENETRLNSVLSQSVGYTGVAGFYTDHYKQATPMMEGLARKIFARGLGYLELNPSPPSTISDAAKDTGSPYAQGVINLGDERFLKTITDAFEIAEALALDKKRVILLAPPYPKVLEALGSWQSSLASKGIVLAPLSAAMLHEAKP